MDKAGESVRARVFISCGQRTNEEKQIGLAAKALLDQRFEAYFAERVHSLEALTENIFRHLRKSEYAVFIDCRREEVRPGKSRGSVFVNQELAIATFLQIESIVFHEEGLIREGVVEYLIANPIPFKNRDEFLAKLQDASKDWRSDWRNELSLEIGTVHKDVAIVNQPGQPRSDWYHLRVVNRHISKHARNCVAYVSSIKNLATGQEIAPGNIELVWAGTGLYKRDILPKTKDAEVDAFFILQGENIIRFQHRPSTSTAYQMPTLGRGNYELTYLIISENFEPVQGTFRLQFGGDSRQVTFST